jgi:hypothetical protein
MAANANLGVCSFAARYGLPGGNVFSWLKSGSYQRGARNPEQARILAERTARARERARNQVLVDALNNLSFLNSVKWRYSLVVARCLAGRIESCEEHFLSPAIHPADAHMVRGLAEAVPELWVGGRLPVESMDEEGMLTDLEAEFGRERFARFWTSELEVADAFRDAFGMSAGEWTYRWAAAHHPEATRQTRFGLASFGYGSQTVVLILAALVVAVLSERRRRAT